MTYTIKQGDSLSSISKQFLGDGSRYTELMSVNNLTSDKIVPGQVITIPERKNPRPSKTYTVISGDNLSTIAKKNNTTVDDIVSLNNINNLNKIQIGLVLKLPNNTPLTSRQNYQDIFTYELNINQKSDIDIINAYHSKKKTGEYYLIDDKKNDMLHVYKDGIKVKSYNVIHGKNRESDEMTVTKTDANGHIINKAGNMSTPAGLYFTSRTGMYKGVPAFMRRTEQQVRSNSSRGIPSSIHFREILPGANTNGCTGISAKDAQDLVKYIKGDVRTYILPADNRNRFFLRNGEILFKSYDINKTPAFNTVVNKPIDLIRWSTEGLTETNKRVIRDFATALQNNKLKLQKDLGINNDTYIELASRALGILGVESGYGNEHSAIGNALRMVQKVVNRNSGAADYKSKYHTYHINGDNNSVGLTQIRWKYLTEQEKALFDKWGITKDSVVDNPKKAAIATMIKLATNYKTSHNLDKAVSLWNRKPSYILLVNNNRKRFNFYQHYQQGGNLTKKDKLIAWDQRNTFGHSDNYNDYFDYWDFLKDDSATKWFKSYLDSVGFNRIINNQNNWWESRHPYRKYYSNPDQGTQHWFDLSKQQTPVTLTFAGPMAGSYSQKGRDYNYNFVGRDYPDQFGYDFTLGHESWHGMSPRGLFDTLYFNEKSALLEALDMNTKTKKGHDSDPAEKHADIQGLKYLFYKEGIYDARGKKDITLDLVKKLRERFPLLRPFEQMSDEQILFLINNVADTGIIPDLNLYTT